MAALVFWLPGYRAAQPLIAAWSSQQRQLRFSRNPNSGIAEGSIFVIFGQNLGRAKIVQVISFPLPTTAGVGGDIGAGHRQWDILTAIMLYTLATQVAAVLPSARLSDTGTLTVTYNGQVSARLPSPW